VEAFTIWLPVGAFPKYYEFFDRTFCVMKYFVGKVTGCLKAFGTSQINIITSNPRSLYNLRAHFEGHFPYFGMRRVSTCEITEIGTSNALVFVLIKRNIWFSLHKRIIP
jgi:hypothetical protein